MEKTTKPTVVIQRDEAPESLIERALEGDQEARGQILRCDLANARFLVPKKDGSGFSKRRSIAAASTYLVHRQGLPREVGKTPVEAWASKVHCPIDGSILSAGESFAFGLDYGDPPDIDLLTSIRILIDRRRLGDTQENQADRVEEILEAKEIPSDSPFWKRSTSMLRNIDDLERRLAKRWIEDGPSFDQDDRSTIGHDSDHERSRRAIGESKDATLWHEKISFLEGQHALASDASQKFSIKKQLEEAHRALAAM